MHDQGTTLDAKHPPNPPQPLPPALSFRVSHYHFFFKHFLQVQGGARRRACTVKPSHSPARVRKGKTANPPKERWHEAHNATVPSRARRKSRTRRPGLTSPFPKCWLTLRPLPYAQAKRDNQKNQAKHINFDSAPSLLRHSRRALSPPFFLWW